MRRGKRVTFRVAATIGALFVSTPAYPCSASSAGVAFGAYNPKSASARDSAGTITINCPKAGKGVIISVGAGASGSFAQRRMSNGQSTLGYNLYSNTARTLLLGDGSGGSTRFSLGDFRGTTTRTVYGRIPAGQNVTAGTYGDTLVVTVTF